MNRRKAIKLAAMTAATSTLGFNATANTPMEKDKELKNNIKHSACRWCYESIPFEEFCKKAKEIGLQSIELTGPEEWQILKKYGLTCAMGWGKYPEGVGLTNFFSNPKNHDALTEFYEKLIPQAAEAGIKNLICLSGNRDGRNDYEGLLNCKKGIQRIIKTAEKYDITIAMELLNSRVDHPDHQCDRTEWGVVLCEMIGSSHFKLLYDIYHMQIMEGDIIATIKKYHSYICHYHTGGVPGRHEINATQELNYPLIMQTIVNTGYKGFVGQEFIPTATTTEGKINALKEAILICDV